MRSTLKFYYKSDGTLERRDANSLFQGQVGTAEYYLYIDDDVSDPWLPTDVILITFGRQDGKTSSQQMLITPDRAGWVYTSNGWETDVPSGDETSSLNISFTRIRYSIVHSQKVQQVFPTETINVPVYPSAGYIPLNIADDDMSTLMQGIAQAADSAISAAQSATIAQAAAESAKEAAKTYEKSFTKGEWAAVNGRYRLIVQQNEHGFQNPYVDKILIEFEDEDGIHMSEVSYEDKILTVTKAIMVYVDVPLASYSQYSGKIIIKGV